MIRTLLELLFYQEVHVLNGTQRYTYTCFNHFKNLILHILLIRKWPLKENIACTIITYVFSLPFCLSVLTHINTEPSLGHFINNTWELLDSSPDYSSNLFTAIYLLLDGVLILVIPVDRKLCQKWKIKMFLF